MNPPNVAGRVVLPADEARRPAEEHPCAESPFVDEQVAGVDRVEVQLLLVSRS